MSSSLGGSGARGSRMALFVFNPTLTPENPRPTEEEISDAKIVYYSPSCASLEEKRSQVGLVEGLISFAAMFNQQEKGPLQAIRTAQYAFSLLEAEPNIWLVWVVRHPPAKVTSTSHDGRSSSSTAPAPSDLDEEALSDSTLGAVLQNCYNIFRLLHGEIQTFIKDQSLLKLLDILEDFVPAYLETVDAVEMDIFQTMDGLQYSSAELNVCVDLHCFLDKLQEEFPAIRHAAILYNARLLYSTMSLPDTRVLYSYLVSFSGSVSNNKLNRPPYGRIPTAASQPGGGSSSFGRSLLLSEDEGFLFGLSRSKRPGAAGPASLFVPAVYLSDGGRGQLVVLTFQGMLLVLIFEPDEHLDAKLLESVRQTCTRPSGDGLSLPELRPAIARQHAEVAEKEDEFRFVYYNHANHSLKLSYKPPVSRGFLQGGRAAQWGPKPDERTILCPLHEALNNRQAAFREVSYLSADRGWICAKRWREREFYLLMEDPSTSLSRCQDECARFANFHFSSIFMM